MKFYTTHTSKEIIKNKYTFIGQGIEWHSYLNFQNMGCVRQGICYCLLKFKFDSHVNIA